MDQEREMAKTVANERDGGKGGRERKVNVNETAREDEIGKNAKPNVMLYNTLSTRLWDLGGPRNCQQSIRRGDLSKLLIAGNDGNL